MNTEQQIQSLQTHVEQLRIKVEELAKKVSGEEPPSGPPSIVNELLQKLDKTKEVDAGVIIGSVWRTKHGTASSLNTSTGGFESWLKVPDAYVAKIVQPFADPKPLAILKAFLDGAEKSKEDLQEVSGIEGEELDKLLMTLIELRYIKCETKQSVKRGSVIKKDAFSLGQRGRDLLLVLLWRADEQRKYEEEEEG
ncbi:TPA: hypothetical protein EYP66_12035 [Candidatus Poribacteria bacterium]|nr:hypothetical protein [Candidatus Poribacteria bacterium]